jgi:hypothetical protein
MVHLFRKQKSTDHYQLMLSIGKLAHLAQLQEKVEAADDYVLDSMRSLSQFDSL